MRRYASYGRHAFALMKCDEREGDRQTKLLDTYNGQSGFYYRPSRHMLISWKSLCKFHIASKLPIVVLFVSFRVRVLDAHTMGRCCLKLFALETDMMKSHNSNAIEH